MHMAMVIGGGIVLLGVFLLFGRLWGVTGPAYGAAAMSFLPVWLLVAIANLWVGVAKAGYTLRAELPILAVVFIVPALASALVIWRTAR